MLHGTALMTSAAIALTMDDWHVTAAVVHFIKMTGYKWIDQDFSEKALLNFESAQREDGRIPLWGPDLLP